MASEIKTKPVDFDVDKFLTSVEPVSVSDMKEQYKLD